MQLAAAQRATTKVSDTEAEELELFPKYLTSDKPLKKSQDALEEMAKGFQQLRFFYQSYNPSNNFK